MNANANRIGDDPPEGRPAPPSPAADAPDANPPAMNAPEVKTILYLDHTAKMGGGEIALLNLILALDWSRYSPVVALAAEGPLAEKLRAAGVETHVLPLDRALLDTRKDSLGASSLLRLGQVARLAAYTLRLARWTRGRRVDLIHTNSLKSDLYGGVAGRLAGVPVLWHVRDNIDGQYLPARVAGAFRALSRLLPRAVIANSESTLRTLRPLARQTTATVYSGVADYGGAGRPPAPPQGRSVQVVHDGYDTQAFGPQAAADQTVEQTAEQELGVRPAPPAAPVVPAKRPLVVLVGRIADWKGQDVFIRAAALTRDAFPLARFQIIGAPLFGEYEYEASLHRLCAELGVEDRVEFLGFRSDVPALLAEADVVVHASTLGEPFGQVVIEGMAAGKPVIATDGGALPEIVLPGKTGLLVPMGDAPAMGEAISALLSDPVRARAMGEAGRLRVQERFTISHTVRKMERIYDHLLNHHALPLTAGSAQLGEKFPADL